MAASLVIRVPGGEQCRFRPGWPTRKLGEHLHPIFTGVEWPWALLLTLLLVISPLAARVQLPSLSRHSTRGGSSLSGTRGGSSVNGTRGGSSPSEWHTWRVLAGWHTWWVLSE